VGNAFANCGTYSVTPPKCFTLDSNVLVYALDREAGERHALASRIINLAAVADCWLTLQAVAEFYAVVTRKRLVVPADAVAQAEDWLVMFRTAAASADAVRAALSVAADGRASYWDALLVATAAEAGCTAILTEDLADGSILLGVRAINPFGEGDVAPEAQALLSAA
jgi:predicted nucleic acid-binding protein